MRPLLEENSNAAPAWSSLPPRQAPASRYAVDQRSPWHSPVPYLFGGLAALLGLISFALLVLACSCWKLSENPSGEEDVEKGASERGREVVRIYEEKILVIMAGEKRPTYLASPAAWSFSGDCNRKKEMSEGQRIGDKGTESSEKFDKNGCGDSSGAVASQENDDREAPFTEAAAF
ncbi:hypothetical protein SAY87_019085 [Trapa incisa]|uniref:Glutamine dumper 3 n=1 Tax=Trapa incisa TaxID=236973 RepID=A0AAN7K3X5_9MYRT|nr:hypothetical protein SAY87_019085 [Trapa incisa]